MTSMADDCIFSLTKDKLFFHEYRKAADCLSHHILGCELYFYINLNCSYLSIQTPLTILKLDYNRRKQNKVVPVTIAKL